MLDVTLNMLKGATVSLESYYRGCNAGHFIGYGIYGKGLIIVTDTGVFVMEQVCYYLIWVTNRYGNRPTE